VSAPWWAALPPAQSQISCGAGQHLLRWADGELTAADHPDAEGELVLAALGGDKSECVTLVEAWGAHADDLDVLALGPRSPADQLTVTWELVRGLRSAISPQPGQPPAQPARPGQRPGRPLAGRLRPRSLPMRQVSPEVRQAQARRAELIGLFALGRDFQLALSGTVAAAWSAGPAPGRDLAAARPALAAALAGRLAPAAASWLGIDPEAVRAELHDGPGWGTVELTGGTLRATLPVRWLAAVWAAGCPVVDGHLVVDVLAAAWPQAQVRALTRPGAAPAVRSIRYDGEHWSVAATD
jgi:hypothetical protein